MILIWSKSNRLQQKQKKVLNSYMHLELFFLFYFRFYNGILERDTYTFDRTSNAQRKSLNNNKPRLALWKSMLLAARARARGWLGVP